jgi:predicted GNAT family acetyltransferase
LLVAAGKLQDLDEALVHVGVITHPAHRGRGFGRAVVGAMTAHALRAGRAPLYRTLLANAPAVAVARALGYREYARTLALHYAVKVEQEVLTAGDLTENAQWEWEPPAG